jgi:hypothetical protein
MACKLTPRITQKRAISLISIVVLAKYLLNHALYTINVKGRIETTIFNITH